MAATFAQDMDDRSQPVRDRVAASKELREILAVLDTAIVPPKVPGRTAGGVPADGISDDDDPFEIGAGPPELGDPSQPAAS